ncbi:hypothetical protein E2C01_031919 [Portunus trituberculatus]|uniref:Uncharacterized protein n=1 Tax=Portunus trituberculatus TaxID=210409 RepID=A0A5B7EZY2_PORTR|nr:hypothetical protein [Portunus trituberculatus]
MSAYRNQHLESIIIIIIIKFSRMITPQCTKHLPFSDVSGGPSPPCTTTPLLRSPLRHAQ